MVCLTAAEAAVAAAAVSAAAEAAAVAAAEAAAVKVMPLLITFYRVLNLESSAVMAAAAEAKVPAKAGIKVMGEVPKVVAKEIKRERRESRQNWILRTSYPKIRNWIRLEGSLVLYMTIFFKE